MSQTIEHRVSGCRRDDCPVNSGGACIQDFENAEECDQIILEEVKGKQQEEFVSVRNGAAYSLVEVATVLQDRKVPTVAIIGAQASGKTTFLAMLFHGFFKSYNGFNGNSFMDSETFMALNQKIYHAEIKSRNQFVQMPRTSLAEEPAFHFKTKNTEGEIRECMWIDIPGEAVEFRLSKGKDGWEEYSGLSRATHVLAFLDLKKISDPKKRGPHLELILDSLIYAIQSKSWNNKNILFAFSKADAYSDGLADVIDKIKLKITTRFPDNFKSIEFCSLYSLGADPHASESLALVWDWAFK